MQNDERRRQNGGTMKSNYQILRKHVRTGFTLVEMLIAMALTLILVYAIAEFYAYIGNAVRDGRATIEMGGQLRAATAQLNEDLQSLTLLPTPWIDRESSPGYFTVYEGPYSDTYPDGGTSDISADSNNNDVPDIVENQNLTNLIGDIDDVLAFTIRAKDVPFQAQSSTGAQLQSQYAEVIWFTTFTDTSGDGNWQINEPRFLCRRQLLILPTHNLSMAGSQTSEVSYHMAGGSPVANSLADLSLRENRFGCQGGGYPSLLQLNPTNLASLQTYSLGGNKFGEERVLANLLAFDVRVYDAAAPIYQDSTGSTALTPGDIGYRALFTSGGPAPTAMGYGAWVDLSYNRNGMTGNSYFSGPSLGRGPAANLTPFNLTGAGPPYPFHIWDTWATYYETDGVNQDGDQTVVNMATVPLIDESVNGLDDDGSYGVDDSGERETQPPYVVPLRGIQVRIRMYEPQTRQMRQATVGADFVGD